jgi:hypothetical protein
LKRAIASVSVGFVATVGIALSLPASAGADPVTDFLCNSGSAQFCPPPPPPPAPAPQVTPAPPVDPAPLETTAPAQGYANCTDAWNAGVAPLYRGEPGYAPKLDRDDDGVGCERDPR